MKEKCGYLIVLTLSFSVHAGPASDAYAHARMQCDADYRAKQSDSTYRITHPFSKTPASQLNDCVQDATARLAPAMNKEYRDQQLAEYQASQQAANERRVAAEAANEQRAAADKARIEAEDAAAAQKQAELAAAQETSRAEAEKRQRLANLEQERIDREDAAAAKRADAKKQALIDECGSDYRNIYVGMTIQRAQRCTVPFKITGQINRKDGELVSEYQYCEGFQCIEASVIDNQIVEWHR